MQAARAIIVLPRLGVSSSSLLKDDVGTHGLVQVLFLVCSGDNFHLKKAKALSRAEAMHGPF